MTHRTLNWLLAAVICILMGSLYRLDGPSDIDAARDTAADVIDAQATAAATQHHRRHQGADRAAQDAERAAQQTARFERAARRACGGDNGAFVLLSDNSIQCMTHRGHKTFTAKVAL